MLIQRYTAEVVEDSRFVDHIVLYDDGQRPVPMFHLVSTLRRERFDIVFHMRPRFRLALMTWIARIPVRVGTGYRWYSFLFNNKVYEHRKDAQFHELEYNLHLLRAIGIDVPEGSVKPSLTVRQESAEVVKRLLAESGISDNETLVILHPGSGRSARDWSAEKFGELGRRLSRIPGVKILIIGGRQEQNLVSRVQNHDRNRFNGMDRPIDIARICRSRETGKIVRCKFHRPDSYCRGSRDSRDRFVSAGDGIECKTLGSVHRTENNIFSGR